MKRSWSIFSLSMIAVLVAGAPLLAVTAHAGPTVEQKCAAGKSKVAGKYYACLQGAAAKYDTSGDGDAFAAAFAACDTKLGKGWATLESKAADAGTSCLDGAGTAPTFRNVIGGDALNVANALLGVALHNYPAELATCLACGNGTVESPEVCDGSNLGGATCATQGFAGGGTLRCASACTFDTSGCFATRYVDNLDGTVTDHQTGLQWEKKTDDSTVHDKDNTYTWNTVFGGTTPNGTAFTDFLGTLNNGTSSGGAATTGCFTGHCDWRLPALEELTGIVDLNAPGCSTFTGPCIDQTVFGPTVANFYWSATTSAADPSLARFVYFVPGGVSVASKNLGGLYVRGVRSSL